MTRPISRPSRSTSGSFLILCARITSSALAMSASPSRTTSRSRGVMRSATVPVPSTKRRSRAVRRPSSRRLGSVTTSVPTPVRRMASRASVSGASGRIVYGSAMMPCCRRLTRSTSRTCGSMSPERKPRSMIPMPPSSATAMAISARVIVSMLADTIGRFSVRCSERRDERSIVAGSRRSMTLYCGVNRKSSNVQPRTVCRRSVTVSGYLVTQNSRRKTQTATARDFTRHTNCHFSASPRLRGTSAREVTCNQLSRESSYLPNSGL